MNIIVIYPHNLAIYDLVATRLRVFQIITVQTVTFKRSYWDSVRYSVRYTCNWLAICSALLVSLDFRNKDERAARSFEVASSNLNFKLIAPQIDALVHLSPVVQLASSHNKMVSLLLGK